MCQKSTTQALVRSIQTNLSVKGFCQHPLGMAQEPEMECKQINFHGSNGCRSKGSTVQWYAKNKMHMHIHMVQDATFIWSKKKKTYSKRVSAASLHSETRVLYPEFLMRGSFKPENANKILYVACPSDCWHFCSSEKLAILYFLVYPIKATINKQINAKG